MDRRAQLAAWLVIVLLGAGAVYVANVVNPFPDQDATWPLRARYDITAFRDGEPETRRVHEFEGHGWRDWVDVTLPSGDGPARVARFDGRDATGVLDEVAPGEAFATLAMVDEVRWDSVDAVYDQRRAPNDWFSLRFGVPPQAAPERDLTDGLTPALEDMVATVAARVGVEPDDLDAYEYRLADCEAASVEQCGSEVYEYRYVVHRASGVPLHVLEIHLGRGLSTRMAVSDLEVGLDEGTALVVQ